MEENPGPTIFDIIDPTITVSADSSFAMSVTELKTKILTAFENEIRVSFLLIVNPFTPRSDLIDFTLSKARRFCPSKGDHLGVKGLKAISLNLFTPESDLIDFTLSNARRFCSSKGDSLGVKGSSTM